MDLTEAFLVCVIFVLLYLYLAEAIANQRSSHDRIGEVEKIRELPELPESLSLRVIREELRSTAHLLIKEEVRRAFKDAIQESPKIIEETHVPHQEEPAPKDSNIRTFHEFTSLGEVPGRPEVLADGQRDDTLDLDRGSDSAYYYTIGVYSSNCGGYLFKEFDSSPPSVSLQSEIAELAITSPMTPFPGGTVPLASSPPEPKPRHVRKAKTRAAPATNRPPTEKGKKQQGTAFKVSSEDVGPENDQDNTCEIDGDPPDPGRYKTFGTSAMGDDSVANGDGDEFERKACDILLSMIKYKKGETDKVNGFQEWPKADMQNERLEERGIKLQVFFFFGQMDNTQIGDQNKMIIDHKRGLEEAVDQNETFNSAKPQRPLPNT